MKQSPAYWDDVAGQFDDDHQSPTWRAYMQHCYTELARRWFADIPEGPTLKTDLFEEAITPYHLFETLGAHAAGMDLSFAVVHEARARWRRERGSAPEPSFAVADARYLPWATGSLARILSGSSLDHFPRHADIAVALAELTRCLRPGGCLIVTFDNPHNPLVRLRNALPFSLLSRIGLVPYFVGATYTRRDAEGTLTALGLVVTHVGTMAHAPRAPAIWLSDWCARRRRAVPPWLLRSFTLFDEWFGRSPLQFRSGYYLAVRAIKPAAVPATAHTASA